MKKYKVIVYLDEVEGDEFVEDEFLDNIKNAMTLAIDLDDSGDQALAYTVEEIPNDDF